MKHFGLWRIYKYNKTNATELAFEYKNPKLISLINFLEKICAGFVPSWLFTENNSVRVTTICDELGPKLFGDYYSFILNKESKFKKYIEIALNNKRDASSRHNKVLSEILLKHKNALAIEVPVWMKYYNDREPLQLVGHIDLIEFADNKVWIWDYKPDSKDAKYQVLFYRELLISLVPGLSSRHINCGWFDNETDYIVKQET